MPIPTPKSNEERDKFVSRCMSNEIMKKEFPKNNQRIAVCFSRWRQKGSKGVRGGDRGGERRRHLIRLLNK